MKKTIKRWCVKVGLWLAAFGGYSSIVPSDSMAEDVLRLAITLTARQNANWPDRDGECKRATVYAELTNIYPRHSKRMISQAIEEALRCSA